MDLEPVGWNTHFANAFAPFSASGFDVGRVMTESRDRYQVYTRGGELSAEVLGKLLYNAASPADLPKVGDWVVLSSFKGEDKALIHEILERTSKISRKVAGKRVDEQIVAANVDCVFVVQGVDQNYNLRRLERYLVMIRQGGAQPVILLNKIDLDKHYKKKVTAVKAVITDVAIIAMSAKTGKGLRALKKQIVEGQTYAFVGSSGVGKSTVINCLFGDEVQETRAVRDSDSKGRHTTARRELFVLPKGGCVIDTPGMREIQLWDADDGITESFSEIEELAQDCHFSDCRHITEIKCAVKAALESGELERDRYENYLKMQKELDHLESLRSTQTLQQKKKRDKAMHRAMKQINKLPKRR